MRSMIKDCSELRTIIEELIDDIDKVEAFWCQIRKDNPNFEQVSEENCSRSRKIKFSEDFKEFI